MKRLVGGWGGSGLGRIEILILTHLYKTSYVSKVRSNNILVFKIGFNKYNKYRYVRCYMFKIL
jgi:hypothetical protein